MELVTEVLVRLPVKSLLRFRCVCKPWFSLISSPGFVSIHLNRNNNDDTPVLVSVSCGRTWWFVPHYSHTHTYRETIYEEDDYRSLEDPFPLCWLRGNCVNGLFLKATLGLCSHNRQTEIILWNPSIRKTYELPPLEVDDRVYFGLGYNSSSNDYKVVVIATKLRNSVQICSLNTPTWRTIDDYRDDAIQGVYCNGVPIDGYIYWVSVPNYLISFDVNNEVFNYTVLPRERRGSEDPRYYYPTVYRELIGLLEVCQCHTNLWVKIGTDLVSTPWRKLYTIDFDVLGYPLHILQFKKNGQLIFINKGGIVKLYDFESRETINLVKIPHSNISVTLYKESLVLL